MTAIFAVWNRRGVAVAGDTNVSVVRNTEGAERTIWTDTSSKLRRITGHQVIVATAGAMTINGLPIMTVMDRWAATLGAPLESLPDYVANFLNWLREHPLPARIDHVSLLETRVIRIMATFVAAESPREMPALSDVIEALRSWKEHEPENVFGAIETSWANEELLGSPEEERKYEISAWLRALPGASESAHVEERERIASAIEEILSERFDADFSIHADHCAIRDALADYLLNYIDDELTNTHLLFAGYGASDWVPASLEVSLSSFAGAVPRGYVGNATTADFVWHVSIAQRGQVSTLLRGIAPEHDNELDEHFEEVEDPVTSALLEQLAQARIEVMRGKIDHLSPDSLAFVARSFVELERLGSFLLEDLPSVGGDIEIEVLAR